jgi:hypothetical protein
MNEQEKMELQYLMDNNISLSDFVKRIGNIADELDAWDDGIRPSAKMSNAFEMYQTQILSKGIENSIAYNEDLDYKVRDLINNYNGFEVAQAIHNYEDAIAVENWHPVQYYLFKHELENLVENYSLFSNNEVYDQEYIASLDKKVKEECVEQIADKMQTWVSDQLNDPCSDILEDFLEEDPPLGFDARKARRDEYYYVPLFESKAEDVKIDEKSMARDVAASKNKGLDKQDGIAGIKR